MFDNSPLISKLQSDTAIQALRDYGYLRIRFPEQEVSLLRETIDSAAIKFPHSTLVNGIEANFSLTSETKMVNNIEINGLIQRLFARPLEKLLYPNESDCDLTRASFKNDDWYFHNAKYEAGSFIARHRDFELSAVVCLQADQIKGGELQIEGYQKIATLPARFAEAIIMNGDVFHKVQKLESGSKMSLVLRAPKSFPKYDYSPQRFN